MAEGGDITRLLAEVRTGGAGAQERLAERIYIDLRRLARMRLARERRDHTLTPTALVHEAWLRIEPRLADLTIQDRRQFFGFAAQAMRRILVEHARARNAAKRGGPVLTVRLEQFVATPGLGDTSLLALDAALERLGIIKPRAARVVELRFFAGLTHSEIAGLLDLERRTVDRDWAFARAWLAIHLDKSGANPT